MSESIQIHKNIDRNKWQDLLKKSEDTLVFDEEWYLDICAPNWQVLEIDDYSAAMPLPVNAKGGIDHVYLPFFIRRLNVIGDTSKVPVIWTYLKSHYPRIDIASETNDELKDGISAVYQKLNISLPYEDIRANYSKNAKRILKKTSNLVFKTSPNVSRLIDGFRASAGKKVSALKDQEYTTLQTLMKEALNRNAGECIDVYNNADYLGSLFILKHQNTITYLKSYVSDRGKELGASYALVDHVIRSNHGTFSTLDFGGSNVKSVASFYKKFGASDALYVLLKQDNSPFYHKLARTIKSKLK